MTSPKPSRERDRIRWHCRRGMLELDLVLNAFLARHLDGLDENGIEAFNALLMRTDPELLDLVMGRGEGRNGGERAVLAMIRNAGATGGPLTPNPSPEGRGEIRVANG